MTKEKNIIQKKKIKKGGDYTQTVIKPQQLRTNRKMYTLPLRSPQHQLYLFLQQNQSRIHEDTNSYFSEVLNLLYDINSVQSSDTMKKLINLFTEPYLFMKGEEEIVPLPFSLIEIQLFGYQKLFDEIDEEDKKDKDERIQIEDEMMRFFEEGYDLQLNPYFIPEPSIFQKLHSFIQYQQQLKYGGKMSIKQKTKLEVIRKPLNTAHNFLKNKANEDNNEEEEVSTTSNKKKKVRIPNLSKLILKSVNHNIASINQIFSLSINSLKRNMGLTEGNLNKETLCDSMPPSQSMVQDFNPIEEKEKTKKQQEVRKDTGEVIEGPLSKMNRYNHKTFFVDYKIKKGTKAEANFENKFLQFLMVKNYIDDNVFYFSYPHFIGNPLYLIYFKELMYNVLGRFQFIVNDASGFSVILSKLTQLTGYTNKSHHKKMLINTHGITEEKKMRNNFTNERDLLKTKIKLYYLMRTSVLQNNKLMVKSSNLENATGLKTERQTQQWLNQELIRIKNEMKIFITRMRTNIRNVNRINKIN